MDDLTSTFVRQRQRLNEIIEVLAKYGFASFVNMATGFRR